MLHRGLEDSGQEVSSSSFATLYTHKLTHTHTVKPNIMRTFVVNAAELGSYDQIKTEVFIPLVGNNPLAHIGSSGFAGVISALVSTRTRIDDDIISSTNPHTALDVVKTRWMNEAGKASSGGGGMLSRAIMIIRNEGALTLYAGFFPICFRKVCWCSAFFVTYESLQVYLAKQ